LLISKPNFKKLIIRNLEEFIISIECSREQERNSCKTRENFDKAKAFKQRGLEKGFY